MYKILLIVIALISLNVSVSAQPDRWQQRVKYTINVNMNVANNRYTGKEKLEYSNNSPDTLKRVFFHLYWNAFQPGSEMDVRSQRQGTVMVGGGRGESPDWDPRVKDRIAHLG